MHRVGHSDLLHDVVARGGPVGIAGGEQYVALNALDRADAVRPHTGEQARDAGSQPSSEHDSGTGFGSFGLHGFGGRAGHQVRRDVRAGQAARSRCGSGWSMQLITTPTPSRAASTEAGSPTSIMRPLTPYPISAASCPAFAALLPATTSRPG